ncbi:hypothetical protein [Teredinibacter turnerae]|uniref:hypothetical protein n=1 Tax=Teredinibacter turnerae TaxID=2426 RepID=UPI0030D1495E
MKSIFIILFTISLLCNLALLIRLSTADSATQYAYLTPDNEPAKAIRTDAVCAPETTQPRLTRSQRITKNPGNEANVTQETLGRETPPLAEQGSDAYTYYQAASMRAVEFAEYAREYFSSLNDVEKIHALQITPPVGEGMRVFNQAIDANDNPEIQSFAIQQLIENGGYSGMSRVIEALDRQGLEFEKIALPLLAQSNDPSMAHLIRTKLSAIPEGPRRAPYQDALTELELRYGM